MVGGTRLPTVNVLLRLSLVVSELELNETKKTVSKQTLLFIAYTDHTLFCDEE